MRKIGLPILLVVSFICFVFISFSVFTDFGENSDRQIVSWMMKLDFPLLKEVVDLFSFVFSSEMVLFYSFLLALLLLFVMKERFMSGVVLFATGSGAVLSFLLKFAFQRERPGDVIEYVDVFGYSFHLMSYSYPSGHALQITLLMGLIMYVSATSVEKMWLRLFSYFICISFVIVVSLSRIILDVHFPSDIFGGISIGVTWICVSLMVGSYFNRVDG